MASLHALVLAAGEPSKVPFYIIGGGLAIGAVVLSFVGLSQPTFPASERSQRATIAICSLLVTAAILAAVLTDP